jgi:hypothetical protein
MSALWQCPKNEIEEQMSSSFFHSLTVTARGYYCSNIVPETRHDAYVLPLNASGEILDGTQWDWDWRIFASL